MSNFTIYELKNIDPDDISDVLVKVEKSLGFKFDDTELKDMKTFGELCDIVASKVQGDNTNDCTTQQAFYKLRNSISVTLLIDKNSIKPDTDLQTLFLRHKHRQNIATVESELGFKTNILRPKYWVIETFVLILLASIVGLFIIWEIALVGLIFSIIGLNLASKFGAEVDLQTVGQLAEKISRENYLKARRNSSIVNRNEIVREVKELFSKDLALDKSFLKKEATFD